MYKWFLLITRAQEVKLCLKSSHVLFPWNLNKKLYIYKKKMRFEYVYNMFLVYVPTHK